MTYLPFVFDVGVLNVVVLDVDWRQAEMVRQPVIDSDRGMLRNFLEQ
jgi:hypothetical protein